MQPEFIFFLSFFVGGPAALFISRQFLIASRREMSRTLLVLVGAGLFAVLYGTILFFLSIFQFTTCSAASSCGWIFVNYLFLSFIAIPIGTVVATIAFIFWTRPIVFSPSGTQKSSAFKYIAIAVTVLGLIASTWLYYWNAVAEEKDYYGVSDSLNNKARTVDFGEKFSFKTGENMSTAPHSFLAEDITGDEEKEVIHLIYSGTPQGPNNFISELYLAVSATSGGILQSCYVRSELVQSGTLKIAEVGSTKQAVIIAGATSDDVPFISVIDPNSCTILAQVDFEQLGYWLEDAQDLQVNGSIVSFYVSGHRCSYELGSPDTSATCISETFQDKNIEYSANDEQIREELGSVTILTILRGDLDGDGQLENIFFVRPKSYSDFISSEKVVVTNSYGDIIAVWETESEIHAQIVTDLDGDGKDELLVRPYSPYDREIIVLGM